MKLKKTLGLILASVLLACAAATAAFALQPSYRGKTVILYTGNVRGDVDLYPKIAQAKKDYQARGADVILVDAGNYLQGSAIANATRGEAVYDLMNAAGYDAAAMGLAEFGYADAVTGYPYHGNVTRYYTQAMLQEGTRELTYSRDREGKVSAVLPAREAARFQTVATNVLPHEAYSFRSQWDVTTAGGLTVRFLGLTDPAVAEQVRDGYVTVVPPAVTLDLLADVTVVLSNGDSEAAAGNILISAPAGGALTAGAYVIDNETREVVREDVDLSASDPAVAALAQAAKAREIKVVGTSSVVLNGSDAANRNSGTNLGAFTADALKWYAENYIEGIDRSLPVVAIQNGGNCDDFLYTGEITETDLLNALPFSPMGVGVLQVTGAQLLETIEAATQRRDCAGFAQVSGLTYTLNTAREYDGGEVYGNYYVADSINRVTVTSVAGAPFDPGARYNLVCDNFLMNGSDTYYTLKNARQAERARYLNNGSGMKTRDIAALYIREVLGGTIGARYAGDSGRVTVEASPFADVTSRDYFHDPVLWAVENSIAAGTSASAFGPYQTCTRGEALAMLWRAAGSPEPAGGSCPFSDVPRDASYYRAVCWAAEQWSSLSVLAGGRFEPDRAVSRCEAVSALWLRAGSPVVNYAMSFRDVSGNAWYAEAVRWAASEGITGGTSASAFSPDAACSRAQIVTFLYRCLEG